MFNPYTNCIGVTCQSILLWSFSSPHRTDEARMNAKIEQILTKYKAWWLFIWVSSGACR